MSSQESKTFLKKLKETCKKIDQDVSDVKRKLSEVQNDDDEELGAIRLRGYQDKMKSLKTQANDLKFRLEPKLNHTREFIRNFKELAVDTEVQIVKHEEYLKRYGYKPLNITPKSPTQDNNLSEPTQFAEYKTPTPPNLLDYVVIDYRNKSSFDALAIPQKMCSSEEEKNSESTPTLNVSLHTAVEKETPPIPEFQPSPHQPFPSTPTLEL